MVAAEGRAGELALGQRAREGTVVADVARVAVALGRRGDAVVGEGRRRREAEARAVARAAVGAARLAGGADPAVVAGAERGLRVRRRLGDAGPAARALAAVARGAGLLAVGPDDAVVALADRLFVVRRGVARDDARARAGARRLLRVVVVDGAVRVDVPGRDAGAGHVAGVADEARRALRAVRRAVDGHGDLVVDESGLRVQAVVDADVVDARLRRARRKGRARERRVDAAVAVAAVGRVVAGRDDDALPRPVVHVEVVVVVRVRHHERQPAVADDELRPRGLVAEGQVHVEHAVVAADDDGPERPVVRGDRRRVAVVLRGDARRAVAAEREDAVAAAVVHDVARVAVAAAERVVADARAVAGRAAPARDGAVEPRLGRRGDGEREGLGAAVGDADVPVARPRARARELELLGVEEDAVLVGRVEVREEVVVTETGEVSREGQLLVRRADDGRAGRHGHADVEVQAPGEDVVRRVEEVVGRAVLGDARGDFVRAEDERRRGDGAVRPEPVRRAVAGARVEVAGRGAVAEAAGLRRRAGRAAVVERRLQRVVARRRGHGREVRAPEVVDADVPVAGGELVRGDAHGLALAPEVGEAVGVRGVVRERVEARQPAVRERRRRALTDQRDGQALRRGAVELDEERLVRRGDGELVDVPVADAHGRRHVLAGLQVLDLEGARLRVARARARPAVLAEAGAGAAGPVVAAV